MKSSIVGIITVVILGAMVYTISQGTAFQGGHAAKIIENVAQTQNVNSQQKTQPIAEKSDRDINISRYCRVVA